MTEHERAFKILRDGRKLTIEINCNSEEHCDKLYRQMIEMAAHGKTIDLKIQGTGIGSMDV